MEDISYGGHLLRDNILVGGHILKTSYWRTCLTGRHVLWEDMSYRRACHMGDVLQEDMSYQRHVLRESMS